MTGSGNFPPGRALRPEVRMNKEQEEAVGEQTQAATSEATGPAQGEAVGLAASGQVDGRESGSRLSGATDAHGCQSARGPAGRGGDSGTVDAWGSPLAAPSAEQVSSWRKTGKFAEEAVMKRLTVEELAELRSLVEVASFRIDHYDADDVRAEQALVDNRHALLAMASRLVELESGDWVAASDHEAITSAWEFVSLLGDRADRDWRPPIQCADGWVTSMSQRDANKHPKDWHWVEADGGSSSAAVVSLAKQLGWTSPTQKPNDGGRDG